METKGFYTKDDKLSLQAHFVEPKILQVDVVGPIDEKVAAQIAGYATHLFESGELDGMISDASGGSTITPEAMIIMGQSDTFKFVRKVGVYGVNKPLFKLGLNTVIKFSGRDNIREFATRDEALQYVKTSDGS